MPTGTCFFANLKVPQGAQVTQVSQSTEVGLVMKSTQKGLQISLGFFEAGRQLVSCSHATYIMQYIPDIPKTFLAHLDPFGSIWQLLYVTIPSSVPYPSPHFCDGWSPCPRLEDVEIPSANLRTPYMYDSAQERWAGDSEILKMDGFCVCVCHLVSIWVSLKIMEKI